MCRLQRVSEVSKWAAILAAGKMPHVRAVYGSHSSLLSTPRVSREQTDLPGKSVGNFQCGERLRSSCEDEHGVLSSRPSPRTPNGQPVDLDHGCEVQVTLSCLPCLCDQHGRSHTSQHANHLPEVVAGDLHFMNENRLVSDLLRPRRECTKDGREGVERHFGCYHRA